MAMLATVRAALGAVVLAAAAVSMSACTTNMRSADTRGTTVPMTFERKAELGIITTEEAIAEDPGLQQQYVGPVGDDPVADEAMPAN